ncbi:MULTISPECIES: protein adenylyltransferase SelO [Halocynthiibacter]|uniref:Protein nucleotidyltransferase YdiU n=1 Tax=Halocynthiibacter halioticoli TaxID=2986804 RepID=A0AAE3LRM9_9RHOB|nr:MULTISPECIES: YdiU family protein [Halocynthiibacter]MCV6824624.1 YdiU family protein [Halocynthiibacter halioticoli]MCW4057625.1 YdiU family protein [Halocynthiibacter sp. SDUM655004]
MFAFDNSYARLAPDMFAEVAPTPVKAPELLALNQELAQELGLSDSEFHSNELLEILSGNRIAKGSQPIAQAYAGHQFGNFVPQLGDGRAHLLGEVIDSNGQRQDIVLKGSGRTPFSRNGDGRAWLGPVLREFLVSEAMHALNVPTTRALAIVATGERVQRETALPGAILTRVATSHLRVGTFQYFAQRGNLDALSALVDMAIERHYPDAEGPLGLLHATVASQAKLIAQWLGLGFIHGVMNTDNCHIGGLTIDYGPCAFMDAFNPEQVYSSIDRMSRYAYQNQPDIAAWNLAQFASSLVPLMGEEKAAIAAATEAVNSFGPLFFRAWIEVFGRKLGIADAKQSDRDLIYGFLNVLAKNRLDFTNSFRDLAVHGRITEAKDTEELDAWYSTWKSRLDGESNPQEIMRGANPAVIPRNHRIEAAIVSAVGGDLAPFAALHTALSSPYETPEDRTLVQPPKPEEVVQATFCGT